MLYLIDKIDGLSVKCIILYKLHNCNSCAQFISERKELFNWTIRGKCCGLPWCCLYLMLILLPQEGKRRWKEDGAGPHGLEKLQVARDLIAGE